MKPYYEQDGVTIYHGDAREIIGSIEAEAIISDPEEQDTHNAAHRAIAKAEGRSDD